jgi:electron transfer flavoprotein alpha subunit
MAYIKINQDKVTQAIAKELIDLCPFGAFDYNDAYLSMNAACKMCKICVNRGPNGVLEYVEEKKVYIDKSKYKGICVVIEHFKHNIHDVSIELIGKALELSQVTSEPVFALIIGHQLDQLANELLTYGVDNVYVYDHEIFEPFNVEIHKKIISHFYEMTKVNVILFGGTTLGRSLAPRVAASLKTGLTADCTKLEMTKEGDLMQIRPAFGGNIMAKIHTPNHRPQLATIRYKIFSKPPKVNVKGKIIYLQYDEKMLITKMKRLNIEPKPNVLDIADAEVIIALGRAFKTKKDLLLVEPLRKKLNAELACTRPLIENGWFDARRQIGLSGRTVKPKLLINLGISGAIQYIEGMKNAELIISVNQDPDNKLFEFSHYAIIGDIYEVLPELNDLLDKILEESHAISQNK